MKNIVGVVGFVGSGKNTVGKIIEQKYQYVPDSFAAPLKDCVGLIFGWDRSLLEGSTTESREWRDIPDTWWEKRLCWSTHPLSAISERFTPRIALQLLGTDVFRQGFFDDIWIASLEYRLKDLNRIVITDCRFPNEIKTIRNLGGKVIRVKRGPEPEWWDTALAANSDTFSHSPECATELTRMGIHISEWSWVGQKFDYTIENDSNLDDLEIQVDRAMNVLLGGIA